LPISPQLLLSNEHNAHPSIKEDCLYLNVYVEKRTLPNKNVRENDRKVPVAVWFHGGAFAWGSGSSPLYDGKFITERMDMVVVTVNYRLSAFGFLALEMTSENERSHANFGFADQQAAVEWVRKNIEQFGGDPEKIMIFGQSAGGVSTTLHLLETPGIKSVNIHSNPLAIPVKVRKSNFVYLLVKKTNLNEIVRFFGKNGIFQGHFYDFEGHFEEFKGHF
jgi:carboxylesterase type B